MLNVISIIVIIVIMLFAIGYVWYAFGKIRKNDEYRIRNEENIVSQIEFWEDTYKGQETYKKEELFSPSRMKNGGIDTDELHIEVVDYTAQVPWFIRL